MTPDELLKVKQQLESLMGESIGYRNQDVLKNEPIKENNIKEIRNISTTQEQVSKNYSLMDIDSLYLEVKLYLEGKGVVNHPIGKDLLDKEFGKNNINKLIMKNYLIVIKNGITIGR